MVQVSPEVSVRVASSSAGIATFMAVFSYTSLSVYSSPSRYGDQPIFVFFCTLSFALSLIAAALCLQLNYHMGKCHSDEEKQKLVCVSSNTIVFVSYFVVAGGLCVPGVCQSPILLFYIRNSFLFNRVLALRFHFLSSRYTGAGSAGGILHCDGCSHGAVRVLGHVPAARTGIKQVNTKAFRPLWYVVWVIPVFRVRIAIGQIAIFVNCCHILFALRFPTV